MDSDFQRQRVYDAEDMLRVTLDRQHVAPTVDFYGSTLVLPMERKFGDLDGVQRYVEAILDLNWVKATWPTRAKYPVRVRPRRGARFAHYQLGTIAVPPHKIGGKWAMREFVILHELAHHLAIGDQHGPLFVSVFQRLVSEIIGPEAGLLLMDSYAKHGVKTLATAS